MRIEERHTKPIKRYLLTIAVLLVVIYLCYIFSSILAMLIVSILIAMIFNPIVDFIEKKGFKRWIAVLVTFTTTFALMFIGLSYLIPKLVTQFNTLSKAVSPDNITLLFGQTEKHLKHFCRF